MEAALAQLNKYRGLAQDTLESDLGLQWILRLGRQKKGLHPFEDEALGSHGRHDES